MRWTVFPLLAVLVACAASPDGGIASGESEVEGEFSPYPSEIRSMKRLGPLAQKNFSIVDPGNAARNQGTIGSCASHGFLGLIENQLYNDRGIRVNLSERFQIYANFMHSGGIGNTPDIIAQYPIVAQRYGVMPESLYAYAAIEPNSARFSQDAAQGLSDDPNAVTLDSVIKGTAAASKARSDILTRPEFIGALPPGPYPVEVPLKAELKPDALVPEIETSTEIYSCFDQAPENLPASKKLTLTPREFAHYCLDIVPSDYFSCELDLQAIGAEVPQVDDECAMARALAAHVGDVFAERGAAWLKLITSLVDKGQAVMAGVRTPPKGGEKALWSNLEGFGGGHAVVIVGYLTYDELLDPTEQTRGLLADGTFDDLAGSLEPEYAAKVTGKALPTTPEALRDARAATKLGAAMQQEGGILLFRNSWGAKVGDFEIGVRGYQAMTFDFFMKAAMLIESRAHEKVTGVAWVKDSPTMYCPTSIAPPTRHAWLESDRKPAVRAFFEKVVTPPACQQKEPSAQARP